jgi:hypothetical protein
LGVYSREVDYKRALEIALSKRGLDWQREIEIPLAYDDEEMELETNIRKYQLCYKPKAQTELNFYRRQNTLRDTIEVAALAIDSQGKRCSHQRRLKKENLEQAKQILIANIQLIEKAQDFDDLFGLVENLLGSVNGLGDLYIYDTALRIGLKIGIYPTRIYLHSGARIGAVALGFDGDAKTLEKSAFLALSPDFEPLQPYEIENMLCVCKDDLRNS